MLSGHYVARCGHIFSNRKEMNEEDKWWVTFVACPCFSPDEEAGTATAVGLAAYCLSF